MPIADTIKMKRQTLRKGFALIEKTISQIFSTSDIYIFIADSAPRAHFKYRVCVTAHEIRVWPLGVGLQEQAPKHLKLRRLRAEVVSVEEKACLKYVS